MLSSDTRLIVAALLLASLVIVDQTHSVQESRGRSGKVTKREAKPDAPIQFLDVAEAAGLHFKHWNGASPEKYVIETMGSGVAFLDYNNDGLLDIYLVNGGTVPGHPAVAPVRNALNRNNGDGTFTDVTNEAGVGGRGDYGMGVAAADYDGDGWTDLYVTAFGRNILYHNNGNGTFTDVTDRAGVVGGGWSTSAAFLDYDRDGRLDLFVARYVNFDLPTTSHAGTPHAAFALIATPMSMMVFPAFSITTTATGLSPMSVNHRVSVRWRGRAWAW